MANSIVLNVKNKDGVENKMVINKNDYLIIGKALLKSKETQSRGCFRNELSRWIGVGMLYLNMNDEIKTKVREIVETNESDQDHGICKLKIQHFDILNESSIGSLSSLRKLDLYGSGENDIIPSAIGKLKYLTHLSLVSCGLFKLPEELGFLTNLEVLNLIRSQVKVLPSSIGKLQNLLELNLDFTEGLRELPEEIGNLTNLKALSIVETTIALFPSPIWQLHNLQDLKISCTNTTLPEVTKEIGNLPRLRQLYLRSDGIKSLPSSIGKLQNMEELHLSFPYASELGADLWNLVGLKRLNLMFSRIKCLPSSVGQLQNLEVMDLYRTFNLFELPAEITNLKKLKLLDLYGSGIRALPDSMGKLKALQTLILSGTLMLRNMRKQQLKKFILKLLRSCRSLGDLQCIAHILNPYPNPKDKDIAYAEACNRARFRTVFGGNDTVPVSRSTPKLWPLLLNRSRLAFEGWKYPLRGSEAVRTPDAIYQLLLDCREAYIVLLINRERI